jgi:biopolymer transport protein ExbD
MKKFLKKKKLNEEMTLQITSMADIFTIILVFLLKSYSTGLTTITPDSQMALPEAAKATDEMKESMKLEISAQGISLEQQPVVKLKDFEFVKGEIDEDGSVKPLYKALLTERSKHKLTEKDSTLLVMADERVPYQTMKAVLVSAANTGFVDLKLVVVEVE